MKKVLAFVAIMVVLSCVLFEVSGSYAEEDPRICEPDNLYARVAIVSGFDFDEDLVFFTDLTGHVYGMYEIEDWLLGDIACLVFWDAHTRDITDDEIVWFTYNGRVSDVTEVLDRIMIENTYDFIVIEIENTYDCTVIENGLAS